jgi:hypothetical protein
MRNYLKNLYDKKSGLSLKKTKIEKEKSLNGKKEIDKFMTSGGR